MVTEKVPPRSEMSGLEQGLGGGGGQKLCLETCISEPLPERTLGPWSHSLSLFGPQCPIVDNWDSLAVTWGRGTQKSAQYREPLTAAAL